MPHEVQQILNLRMIVIPSTDAQRELEYPAPQSQYVWLSIYTLLRNSTNY